MNNRLHQVKQEVISYGTYKIDTLTENIDTVMNLNNRTTLVESEILNRNLHYDMGQVQNYKYSINYVGKIILYLMTISEQQLSIYDVLIPKLEQFIEPLDIFSTGHLPITLISPTQLTNMLDQIKMILQKTNPE